MKVREQREQERWAKIVFKFNNKQMTAAQNNLQGSEITVQRY